jgi:hypothetical protein
MMSENGPAPGADAKSWLELKAGAAISVKSFDTGRELRFEGPGKVNACATDGAFVIEGSAVGLPGAGEGPGSEQWVATPCGVAVWNTGVHRFSATANDCKLQTSNEGSHLYVASDMVADDVALDGGAPDAGGAVAASRFTHLTGRRAVRLHPKAPSTKDAAAKGAIADCAKAAADAETVGQRLRAGGDGGRSPEGGGIGELAVRSIGVRRVARAACAVAGVRVISAGEKPDDVAALAAAEARFR